MGFQFPQPIVRVGSRGGQATKFTFFLVFVLISISGAPASPGGLLVWHFDQGVANRWGGEYNVYSREPSWARTYLDPSVHRAGSGHSLRITAHRDPIGFCGVWLDFYPASGWPRKYLDASAYRFLSFWLKGSAGGETFEIALADDTGQQHEDKNPMRPLGAYLPHGASTEWREVVIPLADFRGLNLHRLVRLTLNITGSGDSRFYMDDVAFKSHRSAVAAAPKTSLPVALQPSSRMRRALWAWNSRGLLDGSAESDRFFRFCAKTEMKVVFLSLDLDYAVPPAEPHFDLRAADRYRKFIEHAHQRGLQVEALLGTPEWAARENHRLALAAVDAVLEFNRSGPRAARFDAVHFDVEPYALLRSVVASNQAALWADFLQMISWCAARVRTEPGLRFDCDAPAYFYSASALDLQKLLVTFNGKEKPVGEHLTDIVDAVTIMDYRNEADGAGGVIANALPALRYAASKGKTIFVGLETSVEPDETIDFVCGLPREEFGKRLESSKLENARLIDGWRLAVFSEDINIHIGLAEPAGLAGADREAFNQALIRLAKELGAASDPDLFSAGIILNEARTAMAQEPEWKGFESFELSDSETHRAIQGFRSIRRTSPRATFHGLGREVFDEEACSVVEWLSPYPSFGGLAIHSYPSYRELLEGTDDAPKN